MAGEPIVSGPPTVPGPNRQHPALSLRFVLLAELVTVLVLALVMAVLHSTLAIALSTGALLLALALDRAVQLLVRRRLRRSIAIAIVAVAFLASLAGFGIALIPPAISQGKALVKQAPTYVRNLRHSSVYRAVDKRLNLTDWVQDSEKQTGTIVTGAAGSVWAAVSGVVSALGAAVTVFFLAMFMLIFGGNLVRALLWEVLRDGRAAYEALIEKIYRSVGGYISGLALICGINATFTTTFLAINRVPFFLPLGILSGLSSTIPYVGPFVAGTLISLLTLLTEGPWRCLASVIYFVVYGQIEGNILGPLIFRRTVRVNPLIVTLSILFCGEIGGILGAVIAVPLVAALQIIVRELLAVRAERRSEHLR